MTKKFKKNFYFRYFLPRLELWALFCGLFGLFFILARVSFEAPVVERTFIFVWVFYMLATGLFSILFHGGARFLNLDLEHKDSCLINTYIIDGRIDPKIADKKLQNNKPR